MIDLRQFRQFIAVAEELSFRRAAARLHMAQPPLSAAIQKMERELSVVLFERGNRVTRLTAAGEVFLVGARRAVEQAERAVASAKRADAGLTSTLRVAFTDSAINALLPRIVKTFRARHPDVELLLLEASTAEQIAALRDDRADLALAVFPPADQRDLMIEPLLQDRMVVVLPARHDLARHATLALRQLGQEPWILFPKHHGPGLYDTIVRSCALAGFSPRVVQQARQMHTIVGLVAGGLGVAVVPRIFAVRPSRDIAFRSLTGKGTPISYHVALAYRTHSALHAEFASVAREIISSDAFQAALLP
jgi:DNA-binding transcriptional LysR family regulator